MRLPQLAVTGLLLLIAVPSVSLAQVPPPPDGAAALNNVYRRSTYSPYAGRNFPSRVFWGDTHLHTAFSIDAGAFGNRLGLDQAYQFARGDQVITSTGLKARLSRPLDFLVIADHSDAMGFFPDLFAGATHILSDPLGRDWYDRIQAGDGVNVAIEIITMASQGNLPDVIMENYGPDAKAYRGAWQATVDAAEAYNDPGHFTAFIGYEWTSLVRGNNMHRVVIYRDGGDKGSRKHQSTRSVALAGDV